MKKPTKDTDEYLKNALAEARKEIEYLERGVQIETALEQVRARAMAMHGSEDLSDTVNVFFKELKKLGVLPIRCGVAEIDEKTRSWTLAITNATQQGDAFEILGDVKQLGHPVLENIFAHWESQEEYYPVLKGADIEPYYQVLKAQIAVRDFPEDAAHYGNYFYFREGFVFAWTAEALSEETRQIFRRFTSVLSLTYRRYMDLKAAEMRAREVENALAELKAAQAQLIHNEKMASLGQMTAGIAHEIKNPLNFVNNFAVLSEELAEELAEAIEAGEEDINDILTDLKQNAAAIAKHGRRADAIVKSMMQHAHGGSGERKPTNINNLVDEYVNLAFHGKRAAKPGFSVGIERDYDESVGEMVVKAQEIGRVLLNLLSNAFDAVEDKFPQEKNAEKPTVKVRTALIDNAFEIRISDNGSGIPDEIKEKIFEPFFTTKPTGAGTGLGLSLSYDIVTQGHGGMLSVISEAGNGATFVVRIPLSKT